MLLEKLQRGEIVLGVANTYPASGIIEGMCSGWDFVWIDCQHGQFSYDSALHAVQAAKAAGVPSLLRVSGQEFGIIGKYADLAPSAIMIPMVNSAEQARDIVAKLCFPPLGNRSYGGRRVIDLYGRNYYRQKGYLVIAQIETIEAVENAREIIATDGIDMLFFGPDDMKIQMELPISVSVLENCELRCAMEITAKAAKSEGKFCGSVAVDPRSLELTLAMGYQFIVGGADMVFLRATAAERLTTLRAVSKALTSRPTPVPERTGEIRG